MLRNKRNLTWELEMDDVEEGCLPGPALDPNRDI